MEDALTLHQSDAVMMYFWINVDKTIKRFYQDKPLLAAEIQRKKRMGGNIVMINSQQFVALKTTIS